jgi:two-component system, cell cycle sensor histidine kinase and response regulator CckA
MNLSENLPAIEADATQVRQVVMNLITNAAEAIGDQSGVITITTSVMNCDRRYLSSSYFEGNAREGEYVFVEVTDTGCGMDKETLNKIFEPFFTTKFTGRGLGLAAVHGIVRSHQGALKVYSEKGHGTTFKVLFPATNEQVKPEKKNSAEDENIRGEGLILIVDDEESVRSIAAKTLNRSGFETMEAENGLEALEIFKRTPEAFCGVLLDMTMPKMNGEETFRELRRVRQDIRVVLSSGHNEQEATHRFSGKGLAGFIQKPYRPKDLIKKFQEILNHPQ